jgi:hypothetical protein
MSTKNDKNGKQAVAERAIAAAHAAVAKEDAAANAFIFSLTKTELEDLDLLCYVLGSGKNACISFATKYLCSLVLHSTLQVRLPKPQKATKTNPGQEVEYRLNPEVTAAVRAARAKGELLRSLSEADVVKLGVLYLCKKLLPARGQRAVTLAAS